MWCRLMRHDLLAPLLSSVKLYVRTAGPAGRGQAREQSGRRMQLPGSGDNSLWVYSNVQVASIAANQRAGVHFLVRVLLLLTAESCFA